MTGGAREDGDTTSQRSCQPEAGQTANKRRRQRRRKMLTLNEVVSLFLLGYIHTYYIILYYILSHYIIHIYEFID